MATIALTAFAPIAVRADGGNIDRGPAYQSAQTTYASYWDRTRNDQKNKNNWRNIAIGSGVIGLYGLTHHNATATVLGGLGAAYSANKYEQARRAQSQNQRGYYYRHYRYNRY